MKKTTLIAIALFSYILTFSQNKNMSFSVQYGGTHVVDNDVLGGQFSPQLSYHFFKDNRANLTTSIFYTAYRLDYIFYGSYYQPDGSFFLEKSSIPVNDKYYGLSVSSQIKLFNLEKKFIPFVEPRLIFQREILNQQQQNFGGTIKPDNIFVINLSFGIQYHKKIQLSFYSEYLLADINTLSIATPNYSFGGKLSYLFNISFKKQEAVKEE
jgi:hypothetical protein